MSVALSRYVQENALGEENLSVSIEREQRLALRNLGVGTASTSSHGGFGRSSVRGLHVLQIAIHNGGSISSDGLGGGQSEERGSVVAISLQRTFTVTAGAPGKRWIARTVPLYVSNAPLMSST